MAAVEASRITAAMQSIGVRGIVLPRFNHIRPKHSMKVYSCPQIDLDELLAYMCVV